MFACLYKLGHFCSGRDWRWHNGCRWEAKCTPRFIGTEEMFWLSLRQFSVMWRTDFCLAGEVCCLFALLSIAVSLGGKDRHGMQA